MHPFEKIRPMANSFCNKQQIGLWLSVLFFSFAISGEAAASPLQDKKGELPLPFQVGEILIFQVEWLFLDAGRVTATIPEKIKENGRELLHFTLHTETTNLLDDIWTMDDWFHSYWDINERATRKFTVKIRESTYKKDKLILFDIENGIATVTKNSDEPKEIPLKRGAQDFFTAGHMSRTLPLKKGGDYRYPVFEDDKNYDAQIVVVKKETIEIMGGKIDTILIHPKISFEGAFHSKGTLHVWLSDDEYRAPVKLKLYTLFGAVDITLIEYGGINLNIVYPEKNNGKNSARTN